MHYKFVKPRTRRIMFCIDAAGFCVWTLLRLFQPWTWFRSRKIPENPKRLLLIRADYIGDVLLATHTFRAIRQRFPHTEITLLTSTRGATLVQGNPYIDRVMAWDPPWFFPDKRKTAWPECKRIIKELQACSYDLGADFRGDLRNIAVLLVAAGVRFRVSFAASGGFYLLHKVVPYANDLHEAAHHTRVAQALGADVQLHDSPQVYVDQEERAAVDNFMQRHGLEAGKCAVIAPGARKKVRLWPPERYAELGRRLQKSYGLRVILAGPPEERPLLQHVADMMGGEAAFSCDGVADLRQLYELFTRCRLYVGVSSGPAHLAAAAGVPQVLLFGPELQSQWKPLGVAHRIIQHLFPCKPCTQNDCPRLEDNCIKAIRTDEVLEAVDELLRASSPHAETHGDCHETA